MVTYKVIANRPYDCYEAGDTVIAGFETYKAADDFACHHIFVHADEALAQDGSLISIVEVYHASKMF